MKEWPDKQKPLRSIKDRGNVRYVGCLPWYLAKKYGLREYSHFEITNAGKEVIFCHCYASLEEQEPNLSKLNKPFIKRADKLFRKPDTDV